MLLTRPALEALISEAYEAGANDQMSGDACKDNRDELVAHWSKGIKAMDEQAYGA